MKQLLLTLFIVCSALFCFASTSPVKDIKINIAPTSCTVTSYAYYTIPGSGGDLELFSCQQSGGSCEEATDKANDCRNQKICVKIRCYGLTPAGSLGCKITSICPVFE